METILDINSRHKAIIDDFSSEHAIVIGAGGVGSWVAVYLAMVGFGYISIYDSDKVEMTNLNRCFAFKASDVGRYKVDAIEDLIHERRPLCGVITYKEKLHDVNKLKGAFVFDCTDSTQFKRLVEGVYAKWRAGEIEWDDENYWKHYVKLGYDGFSMTYDETTQDFCLGEDSPYTITNSIFSAASVLAALAVQEAIVPKLAEITGEDSDGNPVQAVRIDKRLATFSVGDILLSQIK